MPHIAPTLKVRFGYVSLCRLLSVICRVWKMLCHFIWRGDQLLIDCQQQSLLCESWCRQKRDRGHVNSFHLSRLHKESPCSPPTKKAPSLPLPKSIILPPALPPPLSPPPPPFSPTKNERYSIYSPSLHLFSVVFLPPPNASNFPHLLCSWILSLLHFLSAYSTQSKWSHS